MTDISFTVDGRTVTAKVGQTILEACNGEGIETPTLCWAAILRTSGVT